jgi:mannose-6-phosphate isomerase-like protein (cupin superfamily)
MNLGEDSMMIAAALDSVGPRLKRLRTQRGVTLAALGSNRHLQEQVVPSGDRSAPPEPRSALPLAQAYRVPLDELVGAPEVGDPRVRLQPRRVNGRTVLPLTRQPSGVQAWKIIIPATQTDPEPRVHEGYEWLYVLSGRMRLVLGDHDLVLSAGEAAEFDTRLPHWLGSTGGQSAEVLSLFGRQGERVHVRAKSRRHGAGGA